MTISLSFLSRFWPKATRVTALLALASAGLLAGCGTPPVATGINDPHEAQNRSFHQFNVNLDRALLRPASKAYVKAVPLPVEIGISNFASNLDLPGEVLNDLLQLKIQKAAQNTLRFAVNTTVGLGGILDPASAGGLPAAPTDFGATLYTWGMPEGAYIEMPVLGPTTDRGLIGTMVDYAMNPVRLFLPHPGPAVDMAAGVATKIGDRGRYSATIDSFLYDSVDGYAQERLFYLENRRYNLGEKAPTFENPYAN